MVELLTKVKQNIKNLRIIVDTLETKVDSKYWPMPTYTEILFGVD